MPAGAGEAEERAGAGGAELRGAAAEHRRAPPPASAHRGRRRFPDRTAVFRLVFEPRRGPGAPLPVECRKA